MENPDLAMLLNNKMGEILKAMNAGDMTLAVELREDLVDLLIADREKVVVDRLTQAKKSPKTIDNQIDEAATKAEGLEIGLRHPKGKK